MNYYINTSITPFTITPDPWFMQTFFKFKFLKSNLILANQSRAVSLSFDCIQNGTLLPIGPFNMTLPSNSFSSSNEFISQQTWPIPTSTYTYPCSNPTLSNTNILGTSSLYTVLAGHSTTNLGSTNIYGSIGTSPGTDNLGDPINLHCGQLHSADSDSLSAQSSALHAYNVLLNYPSPIDKTGQDLGGQTLLPGTYNFSTSAYLTGILILDAAGDINAQWIFQIGSSLTTSAGSSVQIINNGSFLNVYWQVGTSASIGINNNISGNIISNSSITLGTNTVLNGRAFANTGTVAMSSNFISRIPRVYDNIYWNFNFIFKHVDNYIYVYANKQDFLQHNINNPIFFNFSLDNSSPTNVSNLTMEDDKMNLLFSFNYTDTKIIKFRLITSPDGEKNTSENSTIYNYHNLTNLVSLIPVNNHIIDFETQSLNNPNGITNYQFEFVDEQNNIVNIQQFNGLLQIL